MSCLYGRYLQLGGIGGTMPEPRRAELRKAHQRHHEKCGPFRQAALAEFFGLFAFPGDDPCELAGVVRGAQRIARLQAQRARPCQTCGAAGCLKVECVRAALAAHDRDRDADVGRRLARHAADAARDVATNRNGHAAR